MTLRAPIWPSGLDFDTRDFEDVARQNGERPFVQDAKAAAKARGGCPRPVTQGFTRKYRKCKPQTHENTHASAFPKKKRSEHSLFFFLCTMQNIKGHSAIQKVTRMAKAIYKRLFKCRAPFHPTAPQCGVRQRITNFGSF